MKIKIIPYLFIALFAVSLNGCILDAFEKLTQNIPISETVTISGTDVSKTESTNFCIPGDSKTMQDYTGKIESITYAAATFQTISVTPADITGRVTISVSANGIPIFSKVLPAAKPADYLTEPYVFDLTQAEIQAYNNALKLFSSGVCFTATATVDNMPAGQKTVVGEVTVVFEMVAEP